MGHHYHRIHFHTDDVMISNSNYKVIVIILLTSILTSIIIINVSRKQTGRYVGFGNDDFLLDTSTGEIYSIQGSVHSNMIDDIKEKQKQREIKRDSIQKANKN